MDGHSAKSRQRFLGLAIWLLAAGLFVLWWTDRRVEGSPHSRLIPQLWSYAIGRITPVDFQLVEPAHLAVGDPIFIPQGDSLHQVGQIAKVFSGASRPATRAIMARGGTAAFYPAAPKIGPGSELKYYNSDDSLQWVLQTLLPPEKRAQIATELSNAFEHHQVEILSAVRAVIEASLPEARLVVEEELKTALAANREEWSQLGGKYQQEILERQLAPLVRKEIWPIVLEHVEPVANEVGREIWERASLWRFGWRAAYDKFQLTEQPLMQKEWSRFLKEDALPVLEQHADEFVDLQEQILQDIVRNQQVRAALRDGVRQMVDDPDLQHLIWQILREVIIQNPRLRQVLARHWTGPEAQQAFQIVSQRLEPAFVRITELLFGSPEQGISPEFSRVLRTKVLRKDRRWLVLETAFTPQQAPTDRFTSPRPLLLIVRPGGEVTIDPFDTDPPGSTHVARP